MKTCIDCGKAKPERMFTICNTYGRNSVCKPCMVRRTAEWRMRNGAKSAAYSKEWKLKNADRVREYSREYYKRHAKL
jgi:hypothetical protein